MPGLDVTRPAGRRVLFTLLYFAQGAPIGFVWWVMPVRLRQAGMPVVDVAGLVALLALPWALKFLWAPLVDRYRSRHFGYRAWITAAQCAMLLALLPLLLLDPGPQLFMWITPILLLHAVCAATQDVGVDALAIQLIPEAERGRMTGWMQAGAYTARALFGGIALILFAGAPLGLFVIGLAIAVLLPLAVLWWVPASSLAGLNVAGRVTPIFELLRIAFRQRTAWLGLAIAATAGAGYEAFAGLLGTMLTDFEASDAAIGAYFAFPVVGLMITGSLCGGLLTDRWGKPRVLSGAILALAAWIAVITLCLAVAALPVAAVMCLAAPVYLLLGVLNAALYALLMDSTDPRVGGTQFSAYMGATNLCESNAVAIAGFVAGSGVAAGSEASSASAVYTFAFVIPAAISLIALPLIKQVAKRS